MYAGRQETMRGAGACGVWGCSGGARTGQWAGEVANSGGCSATASTTACYAPNFTTLSQALRGNKSHGPQTCVPTCVCVCVWSLVSARETRVVDEVREKHERGWQP